MQLYTVYLIWKLFYMFRMVPSPIIRSANTCVYSIWYLSHRYCYLPLSWKRWNWFECTVSGLRHPQHTETSSNTSTIAADSSNGVTNIRCCRYSCLRFWWWVMVSAETCRTVSRLNKLCKVASCWIYIGIYLRCTDPWTLNILRLTYKYSENHDRPQLVRPISGPKYEIGTSRIQRDYKC